MNVIKNARAATVSMRFRPAPLCGMEICSFTAAVLLMMCSSFSVRTALVLAASDGRAWILTSRRPTGDDTNSWTLYHRKIMAANRLGLKASCVDISSAIHAIGAVNLKGHPSAVPHCLAGLVGTNTLTLSARRLLTEQSSGEQTFKLARSSLLRPDE